ncbi:uncharacterized protein B0H18DRAFT_869382 [Fomitopsis serialis]|uniref:uncharacterized protein n=1 Tax=Fomitopsis serialis TaxID=139415 RepID=UPI0020089858|nr:uncharacterized protein B0H18DRAFT_869382 [Neoantrodia serialis]KAH9934771.1 hypothetical protein B0H18DRAFT_869382 [Neoantrodia serialis]
MSYGSGSSNWGGSGYSNCVQQCMASYGAPAMVTASATYAASATASAMAGTGTTHTIVVAPSQGVLRMVPFAVNASAGDTLYWVWGANNHTVTKSSELSPCNKTTDGTAFASGTQNASFTFTEMVNDTNPVFYYCGTPGHCPKGMFGVINPPNVENNAATSVASMMPAMMANSSTLSAMYAASNISSNPMAATWGDSMDMSTMPDWSQSLMAENVLYTRSFIAANPSIMAADGTLNMGAANGQFMVPQDVSQLNSAGSSSSAASSSSSPSGSAAAAGGAAASASGASSASPSATGSTSGARANVASGALLGVAAIAATFLSL